MLLCKRYAFDLELLTVATLFRMRILDLPIWVPQSVLFSVRYIVRMFVDMAGVLYQRNAGNRRVSCKPIIRW